MKVIFLDIDGVLCTDRSCVVQHGLQQVLDPVGVQMLDILLKKSEASLVLSSTWRHHHDKAAMTAILQNAGLFEVPWHKEWQTPTDFTHRRGKEIQMWLDLHGKDLETYLILDDDRDMLESQLPHFVKTHPTDGISLENYNRAHEILGIR